MGDRGKVSSTLTAAYIVVTRMEVLDSHRQSSLICSACIVSILLMDVELAASIFFRVKWRIIFKKQCICNKSRLKRPGFYHAEYMVLLTWLTHRIENGVEANVFICHRNALRTKRQINKRRSRRRIFFQPASGLLFWFYHHIGTQKSSKLVVIGI